MKSLSCVLFVLSFLTMSLSAQPAYQWSFGIGDTGGESSFGIALDGSGNFYVTGLFQGACDFDPGAGTTILGGFNDMFVAKYDASGAYLWAFNIGGGSIEIGNGIAVDGTGNCYVTGTFVGTVDFDPGAGTSNLSGSGLDDIFVARYDASGAYQWAFRLGGTGYDLGNAIAADGSGNFYVTGYFRGTNIDFDPGAGTANLSSAGNEDLFVAKYNASSGAYQWAFRVGGTNGDMGCGIAVDGSGNSYVAGSFRGTNIDFNPGAGTANLTSVGSSFTDIFVAKYNASGAYQWAFRIGGGSSDVGYAITADGAGNSYVTGNFLGTGIDFDPGAGTAALSSAGAEDVFLAKYNSSGIYQWAFPVGGTGTDIGYAVALDGSGYVYATGRFQGTADFDPGSGTVNLSSAGFEDIYVAVYDISGTYRCAGSMGDINGDRGFGIAADASGNSYLTGNFNGTADFDPGPGVSALTSAGGQDIFLASYGQCAVLPVELVSFTAANRGAANYLNWQTASENNLDHFTVERSADGEHFPATGGPSSGWETAGTVKAAGNSSTSMFYEFTDPLTDSRLLPASPAGGAPVPLIYYRLRQTGYDGQTSFSNTITVAGKFATLSPEILELTLAGNGQFLLPDILIPADASEDLSIRIYDILGRQAWEKKLGALPPGVHRDQFDITALQKGLYAVILCSENKIIDTRRIHICR